MTSNSSPRRNRAPLGQHFLASPAVLARIGAAIDVGPADTALEVGPGRGALTRLLAGRAGRVVAVEKDGRLASTLEAAFRREGITNVTIVHGDILQLLAVRPDALGLPANYAVVANIPYYLTARLIRLLLTGRRPPQSAYLMVQKEVAARIVARPPRMNLLAASVQAYARPEILFVASRRVFIPPPRVDSAFIKLGGIGREFFARHSVTEAAFFRLVRAAFRGQRKTIANALSHGLPMPKPAMAAAVRALGLSGRRPAELSLDEWVNLTRTLGPKMEPNPAPKSKQDRG